MRNTIVKKMCPVIHSIYSIIIPTYHRPEILQKTLQTLDDQSFRDFEVIVVHDGQGVQTKEMIVALRKKLRYPLMFIEQKHKGPAAARNRGIAEASGEFILLLGDDMVPHKDCLQQHHLCRTEDKNSVIVGFVDWHPDLIVTPFMRYLSPKGPQFTFHAIRDPQNVSFQFFYTANLSIPKQVLLENPFDEDFPYAAVEDTELGYRLQKKGVRLVYCQESICYHHHIITLPYFLERNDRIVHGYGLLFKKHQELKSFLVPKYLHLRVLLFSIGAFLLQHTRSRLYYRCMVEGDLFRKLTEVLKFV